MAELFGELDSIVDDIASALLSLMDQRKTGDNSEYYGPSNDPWCQFVLTYNVIETIHSLGYPLDSPRLKRALDWMEYNADHVERLGKSEEILGKLFLLKSFQYLPGFKDKFKEKLSSLQAFIEDNLKNENAKMLPFMALDSFMENELKYENLIKNIFREIEGNLENFKFKIGRLSYAFYLSCRYLNIIQNFDLFLRVKDKSGKMLFKALEANRDYSSYFNESCYCLLNLGRIESSILKEYHLENHFHYIREWAKKHLSKSTKKISYHKNVFNIDLSDSRIRGSLPKEIANTKDKYVNIYLLCIILRALAESSPDPKHLKIAVAHNQLKILYELFFDPVYKKFKRAKILIVLLGIIIILFTFDCISFSNTEFIVLTNNLLNKLMSNTVRDKMFHWAGGITAIGGIFVVFKRYILPFAMKNWRGIYDRKN